MECSHADLVLVPVRAAACGASTVLTCRLPDGARCALAFTSADAARRAMGSGQELVELSLSGLHTMLDPLGIERVQVDPDLVAPPVGHGRAA